MASITATITSSGQLSRPPRRHAAAPLQGHSHSRSTGDDDDRGARSKGGTTQRIYFLCCSANRLKYDTKTTPTICRKKKSCMQINLARHRVVGRRRRAHPDRDYFTVNVEKKTFLRKGSSEQNLFLSLSKEGMPWWPKFLRTAAMRGDDAPKPIGFFPSFPPATDFGSALWLHVPQSVPGSGFLRVGEGLSMNYFI